MVHKYSTKVTTQSVDPYVLKYGDITFVPSAFIVVTYIHSIPFESKLSSSLVNVYVLKALGGFFLPYIRGQSKYLEKCLLKILMFP